jgi:hypothetical protein
MQRLQRVLVIDAPPRARAPLGAPRLAGHEGQQLVVALLIAQ